MRHEEWDRWSRGKRTARYYQERLKEARTAPAQAGKLKKVVKPEEMPWEQSRHGRIKHLVNEKMPVRIKSVDAYIQEIPPGSRSGKHRHMAEEFVFIMEGRGYDLHWDVDVTIGDRYQWKVASEPQRFHWEAGDIVYIPPNTVHQHFNADTLHPARFIAATNRIFRHMGFDDLEQLEDAPEARPARRPARSSSAGVKRPQARRRSQRSSPRRR